MNFLPLLGKRLKDDEVTDVLESAQIEVVYDFDRLHENVPDRYWAASKKDGFRFGFDANQILQVIFLYVEPIEDFTPVTRDDCDIPFFSSIADAETHAAKMRFPVTKGKSTVLGIPSEWLRLDHDKQSLHYEFRGNQLALVTVAKAR